MKKLIFLLSLAFALNTAKGQIAKVTDDIANGTAIIYKATGNRLVQTGQILHTPMIEGVFGHTEKYVVLTSNNIFEGMYLKTYDIYGNNIAKIAISEDLSKNYRVSLTESAIVFTGKQGQGKVRYSYTTGKLLK